MSLRINTNVAVLMAHNNMVKDDHGLGTSLERLSSGLRINKAADDAAGMTIADSLNSQAIGVGQAIRNTNDVISIVQTADAALDDSIRIINTIKTKAIQAAQDGQTMDSRKAIQADIDKLMEEIDMIARTTSFNNQKLLFGNFTNKRFQVGSYSGETVNVSIGSAQSNKIGHVTSGNLTITGNKAGMVKLSIYSNRQNKHYLVEPVEVAFDNAVEHGMGTLADAINKLSNTLGILAADIVKSTTDLNILCGFTDADFTISGVTIGKVIVQTNDADGSLVKAINNKTSQHGVTASVNASGYLTLTSIDKRTIQVTSSSIEMGSGTVANAVLRGSNLSTLGYVQLNQVGSSETVVTDVGGADVVALTTDLEIVGDTTTTINSTMAAGSSLAENSMLILGWQADHDMVGDIFSSNI
jgi:flagellin